MPHAHDLAFRGARRDFERRGDAVSFRNQRVIAACLEILRQACKKTLAVMPDGRYLAVHQARGAHHLAAEYLDHGLMTETDAEYRQGRSGRGELRHSQGPRAPGAAG